MFPSNPAQQSLREGKFDMSPSTQIAFLDTSTSDVAVIFYRSGDSKWTSVPWKDCVDESCPKPNPSESGSVVVASDYQPCEKFICLAARPWIQNRMLFVFGKPGYEGHMLIRLNGNHNYEKKPFIVKLPAPILDTAYSFNYQYWIVVTAKEIIGIPAQGAIATRFQIWLSPEDTMCAATARLFDDFKSPPVIFFFLKNKQNNLSFAFGTISRTDRLNFRLVKPSNPKLKLIVEEMEIVEIHVERDTKTAAFISATMIIHVSKGTSLGIHKVTVTLTVVFDPDSGQSLNMYEITNHSPIFEGACSQVQSLKDRSLVSFIREYPDKSYRLCAIDYRSQMIVFEANLGCNYPHYCSTLASVGTVNFFVWLNSKSPQHFFCVNSGFESHIPQGVRTSNPPQLDQLKKDSRSFKITAHPFQASLREPTDLWILVACDSKYRISSLNSGIKFIGTMDFPIEAMIMVPFYPSANSLPNLYLLYVLDQSGKLTTLALDQSGRVTIFLREQLLLPEEIITHAKFCAEDLSLALITEQNIVNASPVKRVRLYHNAHSSSSREQWYLKSSAPINTSDSARLARAFDNPDHVLVISWAGTKVDIIRNPLSSRVRSESQLSIPEGIQHLVTNTRDTVLAIVTLNNYLCLYDIRNPTNPKEIFKNFLPPKFGEIRFCGFAENTDYLMLVPRDGILRMFPIWNKPIKCYKPKCNNEPFEVTSGSTTIFVKPRLPDSEEHYVACINSAGELRHGFSTFPANGIPFASAPIAASAASAKTLPQQIPPETRPTAWQLDQAVRTLGYRPVVNTAAATEEKMHPINTGLTLPASPRIEWGIGITFPEMPSTTGAQAYEGQRLPVGQALAQRIQRIHTINGYNTRDHICWDENDIPDAPTTDLSNQFKRVAAEGRIVPPHGVRGLKKLGDLAYSVKVLSRDGGDFRAIAEFVEEVRIGSYDYRLYRIIRVIRHQNLDRMYQRI